MFKLTIGHAIIFGLLFWATVIYTLASWVS